MAGTSRSDRASSGHQPPGAGDAADELAFLPAWDEPDWEKLLAHAETRRFFAGEEVIRIGEVDRSLFVVAEGRLEVLVPRAGGELRRLNTIEPRTVMGEIAFVDGRPRSATVRAITDGTLHSLRYEAFEVFAAREPELGRELLLELGRVLSSRLRRATDLVAPVEPQQPPEPRSEPGRDGPPEPPKTPAPPPLRVTASAEGALRRDAAEQEHEVTVEPAGRTYVVDPGSTLLEVAEVSGMRIEYGCRLGFCGADPVAVREGAESLSPIEKEERITLARLGLAPNTRMACCARIHGPVTMSLEPERGAAPTYERIEDFEYDPAVGSVVVIGSGIAGVTAADHVRRRHPDCEIHVVGRETHQLYNRMAISRLIHGRSAMQGLYLLPEPWYDEQRITSWLNTRAIGVDPDRRRVRLGTGEALGYDRLVLATGSSSFVPPIVGFGSPGTFVLREAGDAMAIRSFAQEAGSRRAVVAGGGLLGLEAAYALHKLGLKVSVLERSGTLLRRQLDDAGGLLLRRYLEGLGLEVVLEAAAAEVEGDGRPRKVRLEDGRELPCDLLLVSAGISPNVDLAREIDLQVNRGVVVDDHMRTSGPDIFAAGDVAEHRGQVYGQWPAAVEQAEVAALNAVGGDDSFSGWTPITVLKVVGVDLTSIGRLEPATDDDLVITIEEIERDRYAKLLVSGGRIVGAILLGYPREAPAVSAAIKGKLDVSERIEALEGGDWSVLHR